MFKFPWLIRKKQNKIEKPKGKLMAFTLISTDNFDRDEKEQHVNLKIDGSFTFGGYKVDEDRKFILSRFDEFCLNEDEVADIFKLMTKSFENPYTPQPANIAGSWSLVLDYDNDEQVLYEGHRMSNSFSNLNEVSRLLRYMTKISPLYCFDDGADADMITSLTLDYVHDTIIEETEFSDEFMRSYSENFSIDFMTSTIDHNIWKGVETTYETSYKLPYDISFIVDDVSAFKSMPNTKKITPFEPRNAYLYTLKIDYLYRATYKISSTYDADNLPYNWSDFIEKIKSLVHINPDSEVFRTDIYKKPWNKSDEYMYCMLQFPDSYGTYAYISDDASIKVGDTVVVLVRNSKEEKLAKVMETKYCNDDNAPYLVSETKHILRKYEKSDIIPLKIERSED